MVLSFIYLHHLEHAHFSYSLFSHISIYHIQINLFWSSTYDIWCMKSFVNFYIPFFGQLCLFYPFFYYLYHVKIHRFLPLLAYFKRISSLHLFEKNYLVRAANSSIKSNVKWEIHPLTSLFALSSKSAPLPCLNVHMSPNLFIINIWIKNKK